MALTPEQIQALRNKYNLGQSTSTQTIDPKQKAVDRITELRKYAKENTPEPSFLDKAKNYVSSIGKGFSQGVQKAEESYADVEKAQAQGEIGTGRALLEKSGAALQKLFLPLSRAAGAAVEPVIEPINKASQFVSESVEPIASTIREKVPGVKELNQDVDSLFKKAEKEYEELPQQTKRSLVNLGRTLESLATLASAFPAARAGSEVIETGTKLGVKSASEVGGVVSKAGKVLEESGEKALMQQRNSFIDDLVREAPSKKVREAEVARTKEVGTGMFSKKVVQPSFGEKRSAQAISEIAEVSPDKTLQGNYNTIVEANRKEAELLSGAIKKNDFSFPKKELSGRLERVKQLLSEDPELVGDAGKSAEKVIEKFNKIMETKKAKGSDLLAARKELDRFLEESTGGHIFDSSGRVTPTQKAARAIRKELNDFLDEKAVGVEVKKSLQRQSALFDALDNIAPKAAEEAKTAIGRFVQKIEKVIPGGNKLRKTFLEGAGLGGITTAALFNPAGTAATLGGGLLVFKAGKAIVNPELRTFLGKIISKMGESLAKGRVSPSLTKTLGVTTLDELILAQKATIDLIQDLKATDEQAKSAK